MIILGIDPGSRAMGYGVIRMQGRELHYMASGVIRIEPRSMPERIQQISRDLVAILTQYQPEASAIEEVFMHANAGAALKLGQARGAAITCLVQQNISVAEYTAKQVKKAVVGYGAAEKTQMQEMVKMLLHLSARPPQDAADALAVAICHAHSLAGLSVLGAGRMKVGRYICQV